jgi:hypothetical protein
MLINKFKSKSEFPEKIADLTINMKYYTLSPIDNEIQYMNDLLSFEVKPIEYFMCNNFVNILFFFGVRGCGKTIKILFSSLFLHNS